MYLIFIPCLTVNNFHHTDPYPELYFTREFTVAYTRSRDLKYLTHGNLTLLKKLAQEKDTTELCGWAQMLGNYHRK